MLPSGLKDVLEMIEQRVAFGKAIVVAIMYLLPLAIVAVCFAAIITGARRCSPSSRTGANWNNTKCYFERSFIRS